MIAGENNMSTAGSSQFVRRASQRLRVGGACIPGAVTSVPLPGPAPLRTTHTQASRSSTPVSAPTAVAGKPSWVEKRKFPGKTIFVFTTKKSNEFWEKFGAVFAALVGGAAGAVATYEYTKRFERSKTEAEKASLKSKVAAYIDVSRRQLKSARREFLRHADPAHIAVLLGEARKATRHADKISRGSPHRTAILKELGLSEDVFYHLYAHIDYHMASAELRRDTLDAVQDAAKLLNSSVAHRSCVDNVDDRKVVNELSRARIKLADLYSRQRKEDTALHEYNSVSEPKELSHSFWRIRALNNKAVVLFATGRDSEALANMKKVVELTEEWIQRHPRVTKNWSARVDSLRQATDDLVSGKLTQRNSMSADLVSLVNMGTDDAVDILHLGPAAAAAVVVNACPDLLSANEYLERVKIMLRKFCTSRANCLLLARAPFSEAITNPVDLISLLKDVLKGPGGDAGLKIYQHLDRDWIAHEGATRIFSAVAWALVELVASDVVPSNRRNEVLDAADRLTQQAMARNQHERPTLPDLHSCISTLARARYMEVVDDRQGKQHALELLMAPASKPLSNSVLEWSKKQQLAAKKHADQKREHALVVTAGVPPRAARWQLSVLAYAAYLRTDSDGLAWQPQWPRAGSRSEERDAMAFASASCRLGDTHRLRKLNIAPTLRPINTNVSLSKKEQDDLDDILKQLPGWEKSWTDTSSWRAVFRMSVAHWPATEFALFK